MSREHVKLLVDKINCKLIRLSDKIGMALLCAGTLQGTLPDLEDSEMEAELDLLNKLTQICKNDAGSL